MPIRTPEFIQMQRQGREIGQLRFGTTAIAKNGKKIPVKLETFRFTTPSQRVAQSVAERFEAPFNYVALNSGQETYEILTKVNALSVIIPPGEAAISQWMEKWTGGGCERRCDGITEQKTNSPCKCPSDTAERVEMAKKGLACKPMTRVSVLLPDMEGIGVWVVKSTGFNAAVEFGGDTQLLSAAAAQGYNLPATLWLDKRTQVSGGKTFKFIVPVLDIHKSMREIVAIGSGGGSLASALAPPTPLAIAGGVASTAPNTVMQDDDGIVDAELVEDDITSSAPNTAPAAATPLPDSAPNSASAVQTPPTPAPAVHLTVVSGDVSAGDELADAAALSQLQIKRAEAGLTGGPWAKFGAMTLGRSMAPNETKFTVQEVAVLLKALDDKGRGV